MTEVACTCVVTDGPFQHLLELIGDRKIWDGPFARTVPSTRYDSLHQWYAYVDPEEPITAKDIEDIDSRRAEREIWSAFIDSRREMERSTIREAEERGS